MASFFRKPSLEGGFELVELSRPSLRFKSAFLSPQGGVLALKLGHPRLERLDPALKPFNEAANLGGKLHSRLESQSDPARSPKSRPSPISALTVTFRTHPSLGVTQLGQRVSNIQIFGAAKGTARI